MKKYQLLKYHKNLKSKYPDCILLFRVGDYYQTFGQDAIKTSKILNTVLTNRENPYYHLTGFPAYSLDHYLPRLVKAGHRVAICDQI